MISILSIFILCMSCSKEDTKILGKWYQASTDTKIARLNDCKLIDTTNLYTKDNTPFIYEFFADGKMIITIRSGGQLVSSEAKYTLENNKMTWIINGQTTPAITVSNLDGSNWRYEQQNFVWCPSKTAFNEYYNFKKY